MVGCHNRLYDDLDLVHEMLKEDHDCKVPSSLAPICSVCHGKMKVNLCKDAFFGKFLENVSKNII